MEKHISRDATCLLAERIARSILNLETREAEDHIALVSAQDARVTLKALAKLHELEHTVGTFCDRVEAGEIRSKRTYAEFCRILGREPKT